MCLFSFAVNIFSVKIVFQNGSLLCLMYACIICTVLCVFVLSQASSWIYLLNSYVLYSPGKGVIQSRMAI